MQIFGEQKSKKNGIFCANRRMTSDTMDDEEGGADAPQSGRTIRRASMHDAGTRETAGIKCRGKEERNYFVFHKKQKNGNKKVGTNKRTHERMA